MSRDLSTAPKGRPAGQDGSQEQPIRLRILRGGSPRVVNCLYSDARSPRQQIAMFQAAFPGYRLTPEDTIAEGGKVAAGSRFGASTRARPENCLRPA